MTTRPRSALDSYAIHWIFEQPNSDLLTEYSDIIDTTGVDYLSVQISISGHTVGGGTVGAVVTCYASNDNVHYIEFSAFDGVTTLTGDSVYTVIAHADRLPKFLKFTAEARSHITAGVDSYGGVIDVRIFGQSF